MGPTPPAIARRDFLAACAALAAVGGCRTSGANARLASVLLEEPHPDATRAVLRGLAGALLAFDHPQFPLSPAALEAQLLSFFAIDSGREFLPLRRACGLFDETTLFPEPLAVTLDDERAQLSAATSISGAEIARELERKLARDAEVFAAFTRGGAAVRFSELSLPRRREYLRLWAHSEFTLRRRFYRTTKAVIMISAYSFRELWNVIGYEGPLLDKS